MYGFRSVSFCTNACCASLLHKGDNTNGTLWGLNISVVLAIANTTGGLRSSVSAQGKEHHQVTDRRPITLASTTKVDRRREKEREKRQAESQRPGGNCFSRRREETTNRHSSKHFHMSMYNFLLLISNHTFFLSPTTPSQSIFMHVR